jgi:uncharacterized phage protein gp47/JayE
MTFVSDSGTGNPVFDYSSRDYASVYQDLVNRIPVYMPEWTSTSSSDFGQVLLQMFAYVADLLGYYEDRIAGEAFIQTATQAVSILNLAAMLDYQPTLSTGAVATLAITINSSIIGPLTIPAGTQFSTQSSPTSPAIVFTTDTALTIAGANSATPSTTGFVVATQGVAVNNEAVATSDGSVNQTYALNYSPVSANSYSVFVDLGLGPAEWVYQQTLINSGPYDLVYTTFVDANGVFYIIFGDGVNGYVPTLGSPITAYYMTNVGVTGNVGASTITVPVSAIIGLSAVVNPLSASGGADAESLASIQLNAPASLKTLNRAVTSGDMQTLAIQVPGVQWASAEEQTYQLVNLYVCPFGGGVPSSVLQTQVQDYVDPLSMAQTTITIYSPTYVPINVTANVVVYENYSDSATLTEIQAALANLLALSVTGFGFRVSLGLVYQTILAQTGVNYAIVTSLTRQMLVQLTSALVSGTSYTALPVSQVPQAVAAGDSLTINPQGSPTQIVTVASAAAAGATQIAVTSFIASGNFPVGTPIQDTTGVNDAVLLSNEIPVAGTFTLAVSGGLA